MGTRTEGDFYPQCILYLIHILPANKSVRSKSQRESCGLLQGHLPVGLEPRVPRLAEWDPLPVRGGRSHDLAVPLPLSQGAREQDEPRSAASSFPAAPAPPLAVTASPSL